MAVLKAAVRGCPRTMQPGSIVVDPWNMVAEACDATFAERGVALEVYGRGDVGGPARRRARG